MPVPDPQAGRAFIWLISCFLFLSVAVGGGCLTAYLLLPYSPVCLPYVGIAFVCLPWFFWIITCLYRFASRAFGFRMIVGSWGGGDGGGGGNGSTRSAAPSAAPCAEVAEGQNGNGHDHGGSNKSMKRVTSRTFSAASHESEKPLAISMAA